MSSESTAEDVKLIGGRLCLDFANTVGGRAPAAGGSTIRSEKLKDYRDLALWSGHAGSISDLEARKLVQEASRKPSKASAVLNRAIRLREAISNIFHAVIEEKAPSSKDLEILNREVLEARSHEVLSTRAGQYRWSWKTSDLELDRLIWPIAISATEVLTKADLSRIRRCGGEDCGWIFEDTSKNRRRQWCDMSDCGNLAKVRRFRAKNS